PDSFGDAVLDREVTVALGDQGKALRLMSIQKGWNPSVIAGSTSPEGRSYPEENMGNFNKAPSPWEPTGDMACGQLPEGTGLDFPKFDRAPEVADEARWNRPGAVKSSSDVQISQAMKELARADWNRPRRGER